MTPASPQPGRRTTDSTAREEIARIIANRLHDSSVTEKYSEAVVAGDDIAEAILAALPGIGWRPVADLGSEEAVERVARAIFASTCGSGIYDEPEYQAERERHLEMARAALRAAVGP